MNAETEQARVEAFARVIDKEAYDDSKWNAHNSLLQWDRQIAACMGAKQLIAADPLTASHAALQAECALAWNLLGSAVGIADEAADEWDSAPARRGAGKIIIALAGQVKGYRKDTDAIHEALRKHKLRQALAAQPVEVSDA